MKISCKIFKPLSNDVASEISGFSIEGFSCLNYSQLVSTKCCKIKLIYINC